MKRYFTARLAAILFAMFLGLSSIYFAVNAKGELPGAAVRPVSSTSAFTDVITGGTITVTTDADSGAGSLRAAIAAANSSEGVDLIAFNIPGGGVRRIELVTGLPIITEGVVIDGYTQPGSSPNSLPLASNAVILIELHTNTVATNGLISNSPGTVVRGLILGGFNNAILIQTSNTANCVIEGNFIGTDATGNAPSPNATGVNISFGPGHRIGGFTPAARNVISGNTTRGIFYNGMTGTIAGNIIGLGADGQTVVGNDLAGVMLTLNSSDTTVGGSAPGARNVISGNTLEGVFVSGDNSVVQGNYIGTDVTGMLARGNASGPGSIGGLSVTSGSGAIIGGPSAAERNVIAANGSAPTSAGLSIRQSAINVVARGNYIGTTADGFKPLGNVGHGVYLATQSGGPGNHVIGGTAPGEGNLIAFNGQAGVFVTQTTRENSIRGNMMYENGGLGIDLNPAGSTPNDLPCDADTGANAIQNRPEIQTAVLNGRTVDVSVRLRSVANTQYTLDFYSSFAEGGEGSRYIGSGSILVDGDCDHTTQVVLPNVPYFAPFITATATDPTNNTSEFSSPVNINRASFDFDRDGKTDIAIFRPNVAEWWINRSSTGETFAAQFGSSTDTHIAPSDFTGDGKTDIAFWRPSTGYWFVLRSEDSTYYSTPWGLTGDIAVPGDYDADGLSDTAVYRPSSRMWFIRRSSDGVVNFDQFGAIGDIPVPSDYDGDGRTDLAIFRPSNGQWWTSRSTTGVYAVTFGVATDKLVQCDYTGDGRSDIAVWRPSTGQWLIARSEDQYSTYYASTFGTNGDIPAPGDYDDDGKWDTTVFRPSNATWYSDRSTAGVLIQQYGSSGDRPVPNAFVP